MIGNRSKCVPFRLKPLCVKNFEIEKHLFRGCTKAVQFFINTQFGKDKGFMQSVSCSKAVILWL